MLPALRPDVVAAAAIEDVDHGTDVSRQRRVHALLRTARIVAARIRQHEHVEGGCAAVAGEILGHGLDGAGNAGRVFVIDGKQQRRARRERAAGRRQRDRIGAVVGIKRQEAHRGAERPERDPAEGDGRQHQEDELDRRHAHERQHAVEFIGEGAGEQHRARHHRGTRDPIAPPRRRARLLRYARVEILLGHVERALDGQQRGIARVLAHGRWRSLPRDIGLASHFRSRRGGRSGRHLVHATFTHVLVQR